MTRDTALGDRAPTRISPTQLGGRVRALVADLDRVAFRIELPLLLFIVLTLPWEFTKTWFPTRLLEVSRLGTLLAVWVLATHAANRSLRLGRSKVLLAIGAVVVLHVASYAITTTPNGLRDTAAVIIYAGLALFTAHVLSDRDRIVRFAVMVGISGAVVALVAIAQEVGGFYLWEAAGNEVLGRRNATFGDPNIAARFLTLSFVVCLAVLALPATPSRVRRGVIGLAVLLAIADVLTLSRIGWVLAGVVVLTWLPLARSRRWLGLGIAAFVISFGVYVAAAPSTLQRASAAAADAIARAGIGEPGEVVEPPTTTPPELRVATTPLDPVILRLPLDSVRKSLIRAGVAMAIDHPILGVGVGGFQPQILSTYWGFVPPDRRGNPTSLIHTDAVRVAAETGIVGVLVWLGLLGAIAAAVIRGIRSPVAERRIAAMAAGTAVLVILLSSQFAGRFFSEPYLWLALGLLLVVDTAARWERPTRDLAGSAGRAT